MNSNSKERRGQKTDMGEDGKSPLLTSIIEFQSGVRSDDSSDKTSLRLIGLKVALGSRHAVEAKHGYL
jgi:hypothetical protein